MSVALFNFHKLFKNRMEIELDNDNFHEKCDELACKFVDEVLLSGEKCKNLPDEVVIMLRLAGEELHGLISVLNIADYKQQIKEKSEMVKDYMKQQLYQKGIELFELAKDIPSAEIIDLILFF